MFKPTHLKSRLVAASGLALILAGPALAQDAPEMDEVIAVGEIQRAIESSLQVKRQSSSIVDALVSDELGELPDLSVAESLERITGVSADRFKGGASEISIRGLGPFLGYSTFNGREISSGSGDRAVGFSQFPSELISGALVYKSQQADFIEGGISGLVELRTLKPLDYGKRRIQFEGRAQYSEYEDDLRDGQPWTPRISASYTDQFETGIGDFGITIGGQYIDGTAPEEIFASSSTWSGCNDYQSRAPGDSTSAADDNCDFNLDADPETNPTYFTSNQYLFRVMETEDDRSSVMGTIQWQPNNDWDINLDGQWSERDWIEDRDNLLISEGAKVTALDGSIPGQSSVFDGQALRAFEGFSRLEANTTWRNRIETYEGAGLSVEYSGIENVTLNADISYSNTLRDQDEFDIRSRTGSDNPNDFSSGRYFFTADNRNSDTLELQFLTDETRAAPDLNDHSLFYDAWRARRRQEIRNDDIKAAKFDAEFDVDNTLLTSWKTGLRFSSRQRTFDDARDVTVVDGLSTNDDRAYAIDPGVVAAQEALFPLTGFSSDLGNALPGGTWATWDSLALYDALIARYQNDNPDADVSGLLTGDTFGFGDADVTEDLAAAYVMANFEKEYGGIPVRGNVGVRIVQTKIESLGVNQDIITIAGDDVGDTSFEAVGEPFVGNITNDFIDILPSLNLTFDVRDDVLFRLAAYRALSRPTMENMAGSRSIPDSGDFENFENAVSADGNPLLEPLRAWNYDASLEWYKSDTTSMSTAVYYKAFEGGYTTELFEQPFTVNGNELSIPLSVLANNDESSYLAGIEFSASHVFSNLAAPFDGFGLQGSLNLADTDFDYPDPTSNGRNGLVKDQFFEPSKVPGFSEVTGNVTAFYEKGPIQTRLAYKYRSEYMKPNGFDANRYVREQGYLDASAQYRVNKNLTLRAQALNLTDEGNIMDRPIQGSLGQADFSGRKYFLSARLRY